MTRTRPCVLIVAHDAGWREAVTRALQRIGCDVQGVSGAVEAAQVAVRHRPPLTLVAGDVAADDVSRLRSALTESMAGGDPPLLLVVPNGSAPTDNNREPYAAGLAPQEPLTAAVSRLLGLTVLPHPESHAVTCEGLVIDRQRHYAEIDGLPLALTLTEFRILWKLATQRGYPLSRRQLAEACLGDVHAIQERTIDVHIRSIRQKLGHRGALIQTVRGVGYRFQGGTAVSLVRH
jgi:two-component system alkaline phosphatase synthesis response regulator PhoP